MRYILIFVIALVACGRKIVPVSVKTETERKDSVHTEIKYVLKDTTIILPGDSVTLHDTVDCPGLTYQKDAVSSSGRLTASVRINNGILEVNCKEDSLKKRIQWLEMQLILEKYSQLKITKEIPIPVEVEEPYVPKWVWWVVAYAVAVTGWTFRSPLIKFAKHLITKW